MANFTPKTFAAENNELTLISLSNRNSQPSPSYLAVLLAETLLRNFPMHVTNEICVQLTDVEIVQKARADIDYFACLYERYEPKLMRYIMRTAHLSDEEAQDILQEAFIKLWKNLHAFDPKMKLSSWIYRMVHNETISYWRKQKSFGKDREVELDETFSDTISDDTESETDKEQQDMLTHEVLNALPVKYKSVLILKFIEGMSYEEISDVLKIPEGTVATRINRAKKAFAKQTSDKHISFFEQN